MPKPHFVHYRVFKSAILVIPVGHPTSTWQMHETDASLPGTGPNGRQGELFALVWPTRQLFRLRVNDVIRVQGRLGRIIRVNECAAIVLMNRPAREFNTRFDKHVRLQPSPATYRISANSELEILNRPSHRKHRRRPHRRKS